MSQAGRATACSAVSTSRCPWGSCTPSSCARRCCCAGAPSGTASSSSADTCACNQDPTPSFCRSSAPLQLPLSGYQQIVSGPAHVHVEVQQTSLQLLPTVC